MFCNKTEKRKILDSLMVEDVENLDDHGSPKVQDLVDAQMLICSSCLIRHKITIHYAERKAKLFDNWMHPLKLSKSVL